MAYKIKQSNCTGCSACASECPNDAISEKDFAFSVDPAKADQIDKAQQEQQDAKVGSTQAQEAAQAQQVQAAMLR